MSGRPIQIISTGEGEDEGKFVLEKENLASIIDQVPKDVKVSVVSVVGAFRTGKSFLLTLFLRYLRHGSCEDISEGWMFCDGESISEGNRNDKAAAGGGGGEGGEAEGAQSFAWRGGHDRMTTGIWMWSLPFLYTKKSGEKLAVLLMDTQGMFDNETTVSLTAQIFGISTLVSSYQIYNVQNRLGEDNLQHLALFAEYGRMALQPQEKLSKKEAEAAEVFPLESDGEMKKPTVVAVAATVAVVASAAGAAGSEVEGVAPVSRQKPFQHLQFLVRDWSNFKTEWPEGGSAAGEEEEAFSRLKREMDTYMAGVIRDRNQADLKSTREQITRCFEAVDCFLLPHPGAPATKLNFSGSLKLLDPAFRGLVNRLCRVVFDEQLEAKRVNNRFINGSELSAYFDVYVRLFQEGSASFPKAMTLLDATAEANNRNASDLSLAEYKKEMACFEGSRATFVKEDELKKAQAHAEEAALAIFTSIATMGSPSNISASRVLLEQKLAAEFKLYAQMNNLRNPFRDFEAYFLPIVVALVAWICSVFIDQLCSSDFCEYTEKALVNTYMFIFFSGILLTWRHLAGAYQHLKQVLPGLLEVAMKSKAD